MLENYSNKAVKVIDDAKRIAEEMNSVIVGSEHLLLALYNTPDSVCEFLLSERLISKEDLERQINELIILRSGLGESMYTKELTDIVKLASSTAKRLKCDYVYDEHLFYAMLIYGENVGKNVLTKLGVDVQELIEDVEDILDFNEEKIHPYPFLTNLSLVEEVHPYVSLSNYLERLKIIMMKRQKNNALLIGSAGVGKTAIVEALTKYLPDGLIFRLDLGSMVSGTKYRGELEEKIILAMEYLKEKKAILFIDEIHNIVGAGSNEGSLDVANILKPYLARGEIRIIGATTLDEYYQFIDKDKALLRRFQNVYVEEPTIEETKYILENIKSSYEEYHGVNYSIDDLEEIVKSTYRLMPSRTFPDKAIDVLDEVGVRYKIYHKPIKTLIRDVVLDMSGIRVVTLDELGKIKLVYENFRKFYEEYLCSEVLKKPILSFRIGDDFEMNKFFDDLKKVFSFKEESYLEIDLESYYDASSMSMLIGSSKGYVGYDSGGILSEHIIKRPFSVVYFKNLDAAHFVIQNFIKRLARVNHFLDNKSRKVYLYNTIILYSEKARESKVLGIGKNN
ncbi:MAG: ATP-dependent Clp protease ATP-binding subunit [Bacilli bacterium]|nr:ATP-dependent Clp protease ATP-binding subunit [Bacilli bacterium]